METVERFIKIHQPSLGGWASPLSKKLNKLPGKVVDRHWVVVRVLDWRTDSLNYVTVRVEVRPKQQEEVTIPDYELNQEITYTCATLITPDTVAQPPQYGPYVSRIVDVGMYFVVVRSDGFQGVAPLYLVSKSHILETS